MTRFIAGTLTLSSISLVSAAAIDQTPGVLSSNLKPFVGTVLTAGDVLTAEQAIDKYKDEKREKLSEELEAKTAAREKAQKDQQASVGKVTNGKTLADQKIAEIEAAGAKVKAEAKADIQAKADAEAKAREEAEAKAALEAEAAIKEAEAKAAEAKAAEAKAQAQAMAAAAEAKARDDAEAKATAQSQVSQQQNAEIQSFGSIANANSILKPSSSSFNTPEIETEHKITGDDTSEAPEGSKYMGNYKLTFYCPCSICNGRSDALTASGTVMAEGRTIAVDKSLIPLGSKVYIKGFGTFIAEDTGSAIIGNHIDICVSSHARAYELGVQYGDVYVLS